MGRNNPRRDLVQASHQYVDITLVAKIKNCTYLLIIIRTVLKHQCRTTAGCSPANPLQSSIKLITETPACYTAQCIEIGSSHSEASVISDTSMRGGEACVCVYLFKDTLTVSLDLVYFYIYGAHARLNGGFSVYECMPV